MGWYGILKVVHVLSVVVWIGGATALAAVTARLVRARDRATLAAFLPQSIRFGQTMGGPSSILVLLSGIAADDARIADAGRSVRVGTLIYLLIMTSVIVVMVLKPV